MGKTSKFAIVSVMFCYFAMGFVDLVGIASNYVKADLASTLTFGQFIKAIVSFLAPYIAMWDATQTIPDMGLGWCAPFPIYMAAGILASLLLAATPIREEAHDDETLAEQKSVARDYVDTFKLLGDTYVLLCFFGIMCHVGIDVGTNATAPKLLQQYAGMTLNDAAFATSLYFIFRTIGCLTGSYFLRVLKTRTFFVASITMMALSMACMFAGAAAGSQTTAMWLLYCGIALVGYGNSNVFSMVFSQAMLYLPDKRNAISGLMIMGLFGGTVFPLLMGFASDAAGQVGAVVVMTVGVIYLFTFIRRVRY